MPNSQDPHPFTDADVFVKRGSALRSQMDDSISRHKSRVANDKKHALRFTIRDLFWLTVVVALGLGWGISYSHLWERLRVRGRHAGALRMALDNAEKNHHIQLLKLKDDTDPEADLLPVDWELTTREIP